MARTFLPITKRRSSLISDGTEIFNEEFGSLTMQNTIFVVTRDAIMFNLVIVCVALSMKVCRMLAMEENRRTRAHILERDITL